jgi:hypothetical protein
MRIVQQNFTARWGIGPDREEGHELAVVEVFDPVVTALVWLKYGDGLHRGTPVGALGNIRDQGEDLFLWRRNNTGYRDRMVEWQPRAIRIDDDASEQKDEHDEAEDLHGKLQMRQVRQRGDKRNSDDWLREGISTAFSYSCHPSDIVVTIPISPR